MSVNPYESPQTPGQRPKGAIARLKPIVFGCLGTMCALALLVALLLPATRTAPGAARRNQCGNNLRQIGLALLSYEAVHHALPPAYTVDASGKPLHSWRTLILPFMEREDLYRQIDLSKPWNDPANRSVFDTPVQVYRCPSADCPATHTTYLAVVAPNGCFLPAQGRQLAEITDAYNLTLMVVETPPEKSVHWMCPLDATESDIVNFGAVEKLPHFRAMQAVSVDGSFLFVSGDSTPDKLRALISIAGNDDSVAGSH